MFRHTYGALGGRSRSARTAPHVPCAQYRQQEKAAAAGAAYVAAARTGTRQGTHEHTARVDVGHAVHTHALWKVIAGTSGRVAESSLLRLAIRHAGGDDVLPHREKTSHLVHGLFL